MADVLLQAGADVDASTGFDGCMLFQAIRKQDLSMVKLLLDRGAKVNERGWYSLTALHEAVDAIVGPDDQRWLPWR